MVTVIASLAGAVGCSTSAAVNTVGGDASTTVGGTGTDAVLGPGSWYGARTINDGHDVLIVFVGGPEYDESNPCSIEYRVNTTETPQEVHVQIVGSRPQSSGEVACTAEGHYRFLSVSLAEPFASRTLIDDDFNRAQPVFDGSTLADPTWIPAGWQKGPEGPALPDPPTNQYWQRSWGPPPIEPRDGRCIASESPITLIEGPPDLIDRYPDNGAKPVGEYSVHDAVATYSFTADPGIGRLSWIEQGQGFVLTTMPGCVGDTPASVDTLLQFARSLAVPASSEPSSTAPVEQVSRGIIAHEEPADVAFSLSVTPSSAKPGAVVTTTFTGDLPVGWRAGSPALIDEQTAGAWRSIWAMIETGIPAKPQSLAAPNSMYNFPANSYPPEQPLMFQLPEQLPAGAYRLCRELSVGVPSPQSVWLCAPLTIES